MTPPNALEPMADFLAERILERVGALQMKRRVLTLEEAVEYTGVSPDGLKQAISLGQLPRVDVDRRIRIDVVDLDHWLQQNKKRG